MCGCLGSTLSRPKHVLKIVSLGGSDLSMNTSYTETIGIYGLLEHARDPSAKPSLRPEVSRHGRSWASLFSRHMGVLFFNKPFLVSLQRDTTGRHPFWG